MKRKELTPPDLKRCQAEIKAGSFMTFGPRRFERCLNTPVVILEETIAGADGQKGSMSLCLGCLAEFSNTRSIEDFKLIDIEEK